MAAPPAGAAARLLLAGAACLALARWPCISAFRMPATSLTRCDVSVPVRPSPLALAPRRYHSAPSRWELRLSSSGTNLPSEEELAQQKREAYEALSSFHETSSAAQSSSAQMKSLLEGLDAIGSEEETIKPECWECKDGAISYAVPMDPAAGLKRGTISKPYKSFVQIDVELGRRKRGLRLVESIQFEEGSMPFARSIPLGANVDVDAVDGSYSLDAARTSEEPAVPLLPQALLAGIDAASVQFVVEHTLAVSEAERSRCFLLYGDEGGSSGDGSLDDEDEGTKKSSGGSDERERNYRLLGVILAEETKMPEEGQSTTEKASEEDEDYAAEFISQMIESPSPSKSPSPLDLLSANQSGSDGDKMDRLMESLDKHNQRLIDSATGGAATKMQRREMGMFGITSGVWLGDAFVREPMPSAGQLSRVRQSRQKGFGKKSDPGNKADIGEEDRFATWHVGVQKVALQFEWDYHESVSQSYTYGKVMGTATSLSSMANLKSEGVVVVNEARRTKKREERRVVWDMDGGSYIAALIGAYYVRAPRYMSFSQSRSYSADAYLTEFLVLLENESSASGSKNSLGADIGEGATSDYYCSRSSRLFNANDGSLLQGSTAFFSMKQPLLEDEEQ